MTKVSSLIPLFCCLFFKKILIIFDYVESSLLCVGFLSLQWMGAAFCCGVQAAHCSDLSCCGARALGTQASVVAAHGLSNCGTWTYFVRSTWNSWTRLWTDMPCIGKRSFIHCATGQVPFYCILRHCSRYIQSDLLFWSCYSKLKCFNSFFYYDFGKSFIACRVVPELVLGLDSSFIFEYLVSLLIIPHRELVEKSYRKLLGGEKW